MPAGHQAGIDRSMIRVQDGFLVLSRKPRPNEVPEILVHPAAIAAVEPHRAGCYIYVSGHRFDVEHSHAEIAQIVTKELHR
jgi:hypothetical protein